MAPTARIALFVCVFPIAILTAACGATSGNSDDSADSATDAEPTVEAGVVTDGTTPVDAGPPDSTIAADAFATDAAPSSDASSANAASDAFADAPSLDDVITFGPTTCTLQSGSRIKIRWYELLDGGNSEMRVFDSMYDTVLDARCSPGTTSDGKLRCLPVSPYGGAVDFADPSCTTPIYQQSDFDCAVEPYVGISSYATSCATPTVAVYKVGDPLADAGTVFRANGTDCEEAPELDIYNYFALSPVADSLFVEGTGGTATAGNYSIGTVDFDDGARFCDTTALIDTRTQIGAQVASMTDGTNRILPDGLSSTGYADDTCTTTATTTGSGSYTSTSCVPLAPYTEDSNECTGALTVRSIGAAIATGWVTTYAADAGIECVAADPLPQGGTWNALSDPLPPSTFDLLEPQPPGTGSLNELTWATYGGFRFTLPLEGYDSRLGAACFVTSSTAATAACLPSTPFLGGGLYTDGTCTTPLNLVSMPNGCIPSGFPAAGTIAYISGCPSPRIMHVGAPYTGSMWEKVGNTCNDVSFPDDSFWSAIDDIDPSTYPQLTAVVE